MASTLTYEELEQRVKQFEEQALKHRRNDEKLRESEERFRDLAEGSIHGILIHKDFKPLFVNQMYADINGYAPEEILRMDSVLPLLSRQDQARIVEITLGGDH